MFLLDVKLFWLKIYLSFTFCSECISFSHQMSLHVHHMTTSHDSVHWMSCRGNLRQVSCRFLKFSSSSQICTKINSCQLVYHWYTDLEHFGNSYNKESMQVLYLLINLYFHWWENSTAQYYVNTENFWNKHDE